ncbi:hypothetical protein BJAS_P4680 [Bathymodiolus japonicus methanotrophic gill symbiont]|uniref:hypothetical protein n=2 Tax=Bathymodiolus japonicus methanotrophic gill symbiont TaxID=113269 RepID=UPI001B411B9A|nr:hypothetical protein [Bathymodiolus japonicus methanotrophic gill symbiont]GFO73240.1 hypothetical protein BJAS_P3952 [Bathymodiolus japonicus methanotrophic gill symbiont]GFO73703.1 hypothetical protein BJAS_P4680 [Bathymodiolus japonicus methanotrophic gill symbiont]
MNNKINNKTNTKIVIGTLALALSTTATAYQAGDPPEQEGQIEQITLSQLAAYDEAIVERKKTCEELRTRESWMTDAGYAKIQTGLQDTECAILFKVGDTGLAGGTVFHTSSGGRHGMESSPEIISNLEWGCYNVPVSAKGRDIGTGAGNNALMLGENCESYNGGETVFPVVDKFVVNGYDDWIVPSRGELDRVEHYVNLEESLGQGGDGWELPNYMWSSTIILNYPNTKAYAKNLWTSKGAMADRAFRLSVMPVRSF